MKAKKKRAGSVVLQDKMVVYLLIILLLGEDTISVWMLYLSTLSTTASAITLWGLRIIFIIVILHLPVIILLNPSRYVVWYRFAQNGIEYHTLFRRKKVLPYSNYPYLLHGKYLHGVCWRSYFVFTDRRLSPSELMQINHVMPSARLIKVQYSPKSYWALETVLPPKLRGSLTAIQWELTKGK